MKTTERGREAEALVAEELKKLGYKVIKKNWRSKSCEIDIIAIKDRIAYLVEVKFRGSQGQGDGFSYITPIKLKQMHFAATVWVQFENWHGDYRLLAAAVDGQTDSIELIEVE